MLCNSYTTTSPATTPRPGIGKDLSGATGLLGYSDKIFIFGAPFPPSSSSLFTPIKALQKQGVRMTKSEWLELTQWE